MIIVTTPIKLLVLSAGGRRGGKVGNALNLEILINWKKNIKMLLRQGTVKTCNIHKCTY